MNLEALNQPFPPDAIEWRIGMSGESNGRVWAKAMAYITQRHIQRRLDEVIGPESWRNEFKEWNVGGKGGLLCGISIKIGGEWVTKWDGAENTDVEAIKGGLSDAMKRAAVQWGIGRYLYDLEETFVETSAEKRTGAEWHHAKTKAGTAFWWKTPALPTWALPAGPPPNENRQAWGDKEQPKPAASPPGPSKEDLTRIERDVFTRISKALDPNTFRLTKSTAHWPNYVSLVTDAAKGLPDETLGRLLLDAQGRWFACMIAVSALEDLDAMGEQVRASRLPESRKVGLCQMIDENRQRMTELTGTIN